MAALSLGTLLNPLNSSMIAVALVPLQRDFGVDVTAVTWVITSFYLASAAGQPLMGRLGDRFGPRRLFLFGMIVVVLACALTPFAGSFAAVCVGRVALAIGTASAFPSAIAMLRPLAAASGLGTPRLLGRIQIANTSGAAIGPVLGGTLITFLGWQSIFWVNIPLALIAFAGVWMFAPRDEERTPTPLGQTLAESDIPGILLFVATLTSLLVFLLDLHPQPLWWLLPVCVVAGVLFVWRELRSAHPFLDLRLLAANRRLLTVYLAFAIFSMVYYSAFFGLPQYLQTHAGYSAGIAGLLMFPLAAVTIVITPIAARAIESVGLRPTLITGAVIRVGRCRPAGRRRRDDCALGRTAADGGAGHPLLRGQHRDESGAVLRRPARGQGGRGRHLPDLTLRRCDRRDDGARAPVQRRNDRWELAGSGRCRDGSVRGAPGAAGVRAPGEPGRGGTSDSGVTRRFEGRRATATVGLGRRERLKSGDPGGASGRNGASRGRRQSRRREAAQRIPAAGRQLHHCP